MKMDKSWVGKKVKALDENAFAPYVGAIGTVVKFDDADASDMHCRVRWDFSGDYMDLWAEDGSIELIEDDSALMPYDEIWRMLKPKMEKNGLHHYVYGVYDNELDGYRREELYKPEDFHKAVALAYKMGYERAMKGRPFKYGEKKRKVEGHWEKIDPKNLPEDGTRVRYARPDNEEHICVPVIGEEGVFDRGISIHGVGFRRPDGSWISLRHHADSLDYWVEGDDAD